MLRFLAVLALAVTLCGCQGEQGCTLIGTRVGVQVDVAAPLASRVVAAKLKVCQAGRCTEPKLELFPSDQGGKYGFGDVGGLRKEWATVRLRLTDAAEKEVLDRTIDVTPKGRFPNGPQCGEGGPNAQVEVNGEGRMRERP
ncbi:hypothetical protein ACIBO5_13395 [Nonomuraea angiospora]|uniref:hypothetical protein n=1 Tax=Nonomuraea angiospora TaxID=46172 RepID=UPI0029AE7C88|nr:hypothetical protein [Nonomuraea angiospora]MDX3105640.1 hypothetical protein [Nonomuraea angiospora]